jgi:2-polyprenyl-3-methyl-5-hydroxy-6-metoxy-1,4-benzoquinol methylase
MNSNKRRKRTAGRQRMNKAERFWDRMADKFDARDKNFEKTHSQTIENTRKYLNAGDIVLDYGCATGTAAIEIAGNVQEVHGIDISAKMIEAAKRKAAELKIGNIDFAQATIFDERNKRESFDVILAFNILHLVEDPQKTVQRINELLKAGGLFISITVCMGKKSLLGIFMSLFTKIVGIPYLRLFKIPQLENLITKGNFQIMEAKSLRQRPTNCFIVAKKI